MINEDNPALTQRFTVIQGFLTEHSAFFEAACRNERLESTTRTIKLRDVNENTFLAYLYWMHKEKIPFETACDHHGFPMLYHYEAIPVLDEIIKLWLLADRLMTAKLRNAAADAILRVLKILSEDSDMEDIFSATIIDLIWSSMTKDRAIRRIVIDFYAYTVDPRAVESRMEDYHPDFAKDLALKSMSIAHNLAENLHPNEREKQQAGHYHELDKPRPRSNFHGEAEIDLQDQDGVVKRCKSTLFATPKDYVDAVHKVLNRYNTPEVRLQIKDHVWATIKEDDWRKSFGKVSAYSN